jgi:hypothetical protein
MSARASIAAMPSGWRSSCASAYSAQLDPFLPLYAGQPHFDRGGIFTSPSRGRSIAAPLRCDRERGSLSINFDCSVLSCGEVRSTSALKGSQDLAENGVGVLQDVVVPESQDTETLTAQPFIPCGVGPARCVLTAVQLDHELALKTHEIDHIRTDGHLPLNLELSKPPRPQMIPESLLSLINN